MSSDKTNGQHMCKGYRAPDNDRRQFVGRTKGAILLRTQLPTAQFPKCELRAVAFLHFIQVLIAQFGGDRRHDILDRPGALHVPVIVRSAGDGQKIEQPLSQVAHRRGVRRHQLGQSIQHAYLEACVIRKDRAVRRNRLQQCARQRREITERFDRQQFRVSDVVPCALHVHRPLKRKWLERPRADDFG